MPNYQSTLQIRITGDVAFQTQNMFARIYNRVNIDSGATNVLTRIAEVCHPSPLQTVVGSGTPSWISAAGSGTRLPMTGSPGPSGDNIAVGTGYFTQHDSFLLITASPSTVGSKYFALYVELEYL